MFPKFGGETHFTRTRSWMRSGRSLDLRLRETRLLKA